MVEETSVERVYEYLKKVGPAHHSQIAGALNLDDEKVKRALEELRRQGKIKYRYASYYDSSSRPVIPFRESDPTILRGPIKREREKREARTTQ